MSSPTQELEQRVCQKYGWSLMYSRMPDNRWEASVGMGLFDDKKRFVTDTPYHDPKEGRAAVSAIALRRLSPFIERQKTLPTKELHEVFEDTLSRLEILDSRDPQVWNRFWRNPPTVVGIDVEGNQVFPPVLVQIATNDYCILELPNSSSSRPFSPGLQKLLQDQTITKVFCDNFSHKDKKSLGLPIPPDNPAHLLADPPPHIVDMEQLAQLYIGHSSVARGLSRLVTLVMPELKVRIQKPKKFKSNFANIGRFALIEQGKAPPLRGLFDLTSHEKRYAALDAWCTLQVYNRIQKEINKPKIVTEMFCPAFTVSYSYH